MKKALIAFCLVSSLMVAGCSSGPSSDEISEAIQAKMHAEMKQTLKYLQNARESIRGFGAPSIPSMPSPEDIAFSDLIIHDMQESSNGDFVAKVELTTTMGDLSEQLIARVSLSEIDGSWRVTSLEPLK